MINLTVAIGDFCLILLAAMARLAGMVAGALVLAAGCAALLFHLVRALLRRYR